MKSCVVGNGPSANDKGREIDACDFVVRIKAYWQYGAEDAGQRLDAWAWYGAAVPEHAPAVNALGISRCEHWITQSIHEFRRREKVYQDGFARLERIVSGSTRLWFIEQASVERLQRYLGAFASTGLRAIAMALERCPAELVIAGFDALADDDRDARGPPRPVCHNMQAEKRLLSELEGGRWLGKPCKTRLTWLGRPEPQGKGGQT